MADLILIQPVITMGGDDLTSFFREMSLEIDVDLQPSTIFGVQWLTFTAGQKTWVMTFDFIQDFDSAAFDEIMWGLLGVETTVAVRPKFAVPSLSNPQYGGQAILESYPPFGTAVGELVDGFITMRGTGELTRTTQ